MLFATRWIPSEIFVIRKLEADIPKIDDCLQRDNKAKSIPLQCLPTRVL